MELPQLATIAHQFNLHHKPQPISVLATAVSIPMINSVVSAIIDANTSQITLF